MMNIELNCRVGSETYLGTTYYTILPRPYHHLVIGILFYCADRWHHLVRKRQTVRHQNHQQTPEALQNGHDSVHHMSVNHKLDGYCHGQLLLSCALRGSHDESRLR